MTVKELIQKLQEFPEEFEVNISTPDGDYVIEDLTDYVKGFVTIQGSF